MIVFELCHLFYQCGNELRYSLKKLGLFSSRDSAERAIAYFSTQPGFRENQNAFSIRERIVLGTVFGGSIFEALIYLHSADYDVEHEIELGLYGDELSAQTILSNYCKGNPQTVNRSDLIVEKILNKCILEKKEWAEGFCFDE